MESRRTNWTWAVTAAIALATLGAVLAQDAPAPKGRTTKAARGNKVGSPPKKATPNAADPIEHVADPLDKMAPPGLFHYRIKVRSGEGTSLAMSYYPVYPARLGTTAPVILMVHEKDRSGKDFEDAVGELKGQGFAEHMQGLGYAVLCVDLRGHGGNDRRALTPRDWRVSLPNDLQAAYQFLVDRHNRGKLNLAKLGVLALGEGANLAAAWANLPGAGVSSEGRTSDISALVMISPMADGSGLTLSQAVFALAPRIPLMLMVGERDAASAEPARAVRHIVERVRQNRVEVFDSSLHGYKLLRLEPRAPAVIARFFEGTIKFKNTEWEPRYNLTPVVLDPNSIQLVRGGKLPTGPAAKKEKEKEKKAAEPKK
jgi:hypothetical protein